MSKLHEMVHGPNGGVTGVIMGFLSWSPTVAQPSERNAIVSIRSFSAVLQLMCLVVDGPVNWSVSEVRVSVLTIESSSRASRMT